jgi:hypothetical protein
VEREIREKTGIRPAERLDTLGKRGEKCKQKTRPGGGPPRVLDDE